MRDTRALPLAWFQGDVDSSYTVTKGAIMNSKAGSSHVGDRMRRKASIIIPVVIFFGLIGWRIAGKMAERSGQVDQRAAQTKMAPNVAVSPVQVRDIVQTFDATGNVEAPLNVKIAPKITGRIEYLQVREGDTVRKGQVLVRIDTSQVEADVRQQQAAVAEAQYRLAQAQLTQNSTNTGVSTQIRQQQAAATSAAADYDQTRENNVAQIAAANAGVSDADSRIGSAAASVRSAKANLENARTKYNRTMELYKQGFVAAQDVDDAKATLSVKEADVEVANGQLASASAQKRVAEQQASIVKTKGQADIAAAQARLAQANASVEYAQSNTSQKAAYQQSISALHSAVDAAKAGLRSAQARRADTVLISPLDGFVTGRYVDPGAVVTAGQPAIAVQFMRQIWVTIAVPEEVVPKLHIGQPAKVTLDAFRGRPFIGSIIQINPSADPQSRQFTVRVILNNAQNLFKPGMFAHVSLETDRVHAAVAVPREAVQHDPIGEFAMVVSQDGKVAQRHLITGESDAGFVSIKQGLKLGENVVTMSAFPLRDGQSVKPAGKRGGAKH